MSIKILSVEVELASDSVEAAEITSKTSLLDWDVVLFRPNIDDFILGTTREHQGRPWLNERASFQLKEACEHWRREIKQAVDSGKLVVAFMTPLRQVYVETGEKQYSGTGRNRATTTIVDKFDNYKCIPVTITPMVAEGRSIKLALGNDILKSYWEEFGEASEYHFTMPEMEKRATLVTRSGDRPVGAIIRSASSAGSLVLMPDMDFSPETFSEEIDGEYVWTDAAKSFSSQLVREVVDLYNGLRESSSVTPRPSWANDPAYLLQSERELQSELLEAEVRVEQAQRKKEDILGQLVDAGKLRPLLYSKGNELEVAIILALKLIGFSAASYKDGTSEFDVVFESAEGRLIGEAEGKDSKAINVDKLRQLSMNINEDLVREEVHVAAKPVLFGNAFRLKPPCERAAQFTDKCLSAAVSSSTALVATSDLYVAAQYLSRDLNKNYAHECRLAILNGVGAISFPMFPALECLDTAKEEE